MESNKDQTFGSHLSSQGRSSWATSTGRRRNHRRRSENRRDPYHVRALNPSLPIISPSDHWGTWTALFSAGAFGIWSEKAKIGSTLSSALVMPLLLFRADMQRVIQSAGTLLLAFSIGSVATTIGTLVAFFLVPMRSLGQDSWKIAADLMGRHIGGAVNYVAIADALGVASSVLAAGLAADNVICAVYFTTLFALASKVPPEREAPPSDGAVNVES
ncbi:putative membrane protein YjcL [Drosera capensis]